MIFPFENHCLDTNDERLWRPSAVACLFGSLQERLKNSNMAGQVTCTPMWTVRPVCKAVVGLLLLMWFF